MNWVLITTLVAQTYNGVFVPTQSMLPGFATSQACLDYGARWKKLMEDKTLAHTNTYDIKYDCMKQ